MKSHDPYPLPPRTQVLLNELLAAHAASQYQPSKLIAGENPGKGTRSLLFYCLGYLAKADGRVTEGDIRYAENLMKGLNLSAGARRKAIRQFQQGRDSAQLSALRLAAFRLSRPWRLRTALLIGLCLCHGAQLKGPPGKPRRYRCEDVFDRLGLPLAVMDQTFRLYRSEVWVDEPAPKPETLQDAYHILGVSSRDSFVVMKRTYRRKISRYHPDKLSNDLSLAEQARARDQLLRLQQAWEVIKRRERLTR